MRETELLNMFTYVQILLEYLLCLFKHTSGVLNIFSSLLGSSL